MFPKKHWFQRGPDLSHTFRALRHRNFRLFYCGQSISLIGTWMQMVAVSWLVYRLTNSPFLLGCVGFAAQFPSFILSPLGGVLADRYHRHHLLILTQSLAMLQAFVLAFLVLTHNVNVWYVLALSLFSGIVNSFDLPVRQSFTIEMLEEKQDLANAIALNSSMVNGSKLIGPAVAGILIASFGEGVCFLLNALSYLAVIAALLSMRISPRTNRPARTEIMRELKEGFRYAYDFLPIRSLLMLTMAVSVMTGAFQTLIPVFVARVFHGGPQLFGFLVTCSGVGAFIAAFYLAGRKSVLGLSRLIMLASGSIGVGMLIFSQVNVLWVAALAAFIVGLGMIIQIGGSNIVLQTLVDEEKRGRIMSMYGMAFIGMTPFGSLLAGYLAGRIGVTPTLFLGGTGCLVASLLFWLNFPRYRARIRPVYVQKGILPEA